MLALSRYRQALLLTSPPSSPSTYPPLIPSVLTTCFEVVFCPARRFREQSPCSSDVFHVLAIFLQLLRLFPAILRGHDGPGSLLLTPRLDVKITLAKLIADIGTSHDDDAPTVDELQGVGPLLPLPLPVAMLLPCEIICEQKRSLTQQASRHTLASSTLGLVNSLAKMNLATAVPQ